MWINAIYVTEEMNNENCFILLLILYVRMQISYLFYILIIYIIYTSGQKSSPTCYS